MSVPTSPSPTRSLSPSRRPSLTVMVVICSSIMALVAATIALGTAEAGTPRWKSIEKTNVVGFFAQSLAETNESTFDYIERNFGLLDNFQVKDLGELDLVVSLEDAEERHDKKKAPWKKFEQAIDKLNRKSPRNTAYKVLYLARHGQGFHNVAESFYGTHLWDCYWSILDGNGTSRWDDAELTTDGITEAQKAKAAFKEQIKAGLPLPDVYYSSPLSRAATTIQLTWTDITLGGHRAPKPIFKEGVRETLGIHTCDRRNTKTWLQKKYPNFTFEKGFTETDKLWDPTFREPNEVRKGRLAKTLDDIFTETSDTFISITAHSGAISSILEVIGHRSFRLQTGGVIPVVIKVVYVPKEEPTPTSVSSGIAPICTVNPTAPARV